METGDNSQNANAGNGNRSTIEGRYLLIHLRHDGLRAITCDSARKQILQYHSESWAATDSAAELIERCNKLFSANQLDITNASGVLWLLSEPKFCLLPDVLYQQGNGEALLSQTSRLEAGELIFSDFWTKSEMVGIYALPEKLVNYIKVQNRNTSIAHNGFALNALYNLQASHEEFCVFQVNKSFAELFIAQKGRVTFYNQFPYETKDDLLYFLLFTLEQYDMLAPEVTLYTSGNIEKGDPLHNLLSKYVGTVEDVKLPTKVTTAHSLAANQLRKAVNLIAAL